MNGVVNKVHLFFREETVFFKNIQGHFDPILGKISKRFVKDFEAEGRFRNSL